MADAGFGNGFEVTGVTLPEADSSHFLPEHRHRRRAVEANWHHRQAPALELGAWLDKNKQAGPTTC